VRQYSTPLLGLPIGKVAPGVFVVTRSYRDHSLSSPSNSRAIREIRLKYFYVARSIFLDRSRYCATTRYDFILFFEREPVTRANSEFPGFRTFSEYFRRSQMRIWFTINLAILVLSISFEKNTNDITIQKIKLCNLVHSYIRNTFRLNNLVGGEKWERLWEFGRFLVWSVCRMQTSQWTS